MQVLVRSFGIHGNDLAGEAAEERIRRVLRRYAPRVKRVTLTLENAQAQRSPQTRCLVELKLDDASGVVVDERAKDLVSAVAGASVRLSEMLARSSVPASAAVS
jgi:hypothetical protein